MAQQNNNTNRPSPTESGYGSVERAAPRASDTAPQPPSSTAPQAPSSRQGSTAGQQAADGAAARRKAEEVAQQAAERAENVADTARQRVQETAQQATARAERASQQAADMAEQQRREAAARLQSTAETVRSVGEQLPGGQRTSQVAGTAADMLNRTAGYLEQHDTREVATGMMGIVRSHPIPSLLAAVGLGFLLGRLGR